MGDNDSVMGLRFGKLVGEVSEIADVAINELARECKIDGPKLLYWMKTGKTPDQILELLRYMRKRCGDNWATFGSRIDRLFDGEDQNEKKSTKRNSSS